MSARLGGSNILRRLRRALDDPAGAMRYAWYAPRRPSRATVRMVEDGELRLAVLANEDVGFRILYEQRYERHERAALGAHVRPGDTCVDVGANVGLWAVDLARRVGEGGRVVAFEPLDLHRSLVTLNAHLNGQANILARPEAVADKVGTQEMAIATDGAFSSLRDTGRKPTAGQRDVAVTTLDEAFPAPARVDILKVDVEGAEGLVVEGASRLLSDEARRPRAVLLELSPTNLDAYAITADAIVERMAKHGYEPIAVLANGRQAPWPSEGASENVLFLSGPTPR